MDALEFDDDMTGDYRGGERRGCAGFRRSRLAAFDVHWGNGPDREGLMNTPKRVARMYTELLSGYHADPDEDREWRPLQHHL